MGCVFGGSLGRAGAAQKTFAFDSGGVLGLRLGGAPEVMLEAAQLAAFYSRAKNSAAVPVDYTRRKYVKKPSGANPGMVIYTNQHTLIVDPDPELAERLRRK